MQVHEIWQVPQLVLAARVAWKESKVTKHLYAATVDADAPDFAKLLLRPNDPPIDDLYKVQSARLDQLRAYIYARVSNDAKGGNNASGVAQRAACRAYCERHDIAVAVAEEFEELNAPAASSSASSSTG